MANKLSKNLHKENKGLIISCIKLVDETLATQAWMTKEELAREIGLNN